VASADAPYERVVEWKIPDKRDAWGQYVQPNRGEGDETSDAWDSVIFPNPLKFAMTTASATIREGGLFRGQSQSNWTNPGQRSCLHITKALSLQTDHSEIEEAGKRENEIWMGGRRYYRATVKAEAFDVMCGSVTMASVANWVSDSVPVMLTAGMPVAVQLVMQPTGQIRISVDWNTTGTGNTGGGGAGGGGGTGGSGGLTQVAAALNGQMLLMPCMRDTEASVCSTVAAACCTRARSAR